MEKMDNIYQDVITSLLDKCEIEESMVYQIWEYFAERLGVIKQETDSMDFRSLEEMLNGLLAYDQLEEDYSPRQSYLYGAIWGAMGVLSMAAHKKQEAANLENIAQKYAQGNYLTVIRTMKNIRARNKDLADLCKVSPARISQIIDEFKKDELITEVRLGTEKYYCLNRQGEALYQRVQEKNNTFIQLRQKIKNCKIYEDNIEVNDNMSNFYSYKTVIAPENKTNYVNFQKLITDNYNQERHIWRKGLGKAINPQCNFEEDKLCKTKNSLSLQRVF